MAQNPGQRNLETIHSTIAAIALGLLLPLAALVFTRALPGTLFVRQSPQPAPVFAWFSQQGTMSLHLKSLRVIDTASARLQMSLVFEPALGEKQNQSPASGQASITLIFASRQVPNWKSFEVRDGRALVNYLVRPEADYIQTGGDPSLVTLGRQLLDEVAGTQTGLELYFVTFGYPLDLGVSRPFLEPLEVRQTLQPLLGKDRQHIFVLGSSAYSPELDLSLGPRISGQLWLGRFIWLTTE